MDARFSDYSKYYLNQLWQLNPEWAASVGLHQYDSIMTIPSINTMQHKLKAYSTMLDSLKTLNSNELNTNNKTDYYLIENQLLSSLFNINEYKSYEWNPAEYNVSEGFALILNGRYAPLHTRMEALYARLQHVPSYYTQARALIKNPSIKHTELAIIQHANPQELFGKAMLDSAAAAGFDDTKYKEFENRLSNAVDAITRYSTYLKTDVLSITNVNSKNFRLGKDLYERKFMLEINAGITASELYHKALKEKKVIQNKMKELAPELWKKYYGEIKMPDDTIFLIKKLIDTISQKHCKKEEFVKVIENQMPVLVNFINNKGDIITLDPTQALVVRETPSYMDGVSGASISSPGPFEKNANTYYNVSPLTAWDDQTAESYLREYNEYMLKILNVHEAIPGHYTQLVYANKSPSIIKSVLGNGSMIEGWACYTERMMLQEGWGDNEAELWMMYYKWNLRIVCNTILD